MAKGESSPGALPAYTVDLLRQIHVEMPRNTPTSVMWVYDPAPYTRGYDDGVRVEHKETGQLGTVVGTRLMALQLLVQLQWDDVEYSPGRCDFELDCSLSIVDRPGTLKPPPRETQASLLDEIGARHA